MTSSRFDGHDGGAHLDGHDGHPHLAPITVDGHGKAALLLTESLIHGLIARSVLTVSDAVEIIEIAADIERDSVLSPGGDGADPAIPAPSLLAPLAESLGLDLDD